MADKMFENNQVTIMGEIVSDFVFSHEVYGEGFYSRSVRQPVVQFRGLHTRYGVGTSGGRKRELSGTECVCNGAVPLV